MSAVLRDLMDDLSAEVVADVPIDLDDVHGRVAGHRRDRWRTAGRALLVAAAVALLAAPLLGPVLVTPVVPAAPTGAVGLPDRWFDLPRGLPTIRQQPMAAASMLLFGLSTVEKDYPVKDAVLVSADGRRYSRVTFGGDSLALSWDGRQLAWTQDSRLHGNRLRTLRLADGHRRDVEIPDGSTSQVVWGRDGDVYVVQDQAVLHVTPDGAVRTLCECDIVGLARTGDGRVVQPARTLGEAEVPGLPTVPMTGWDGADAGRVSTPLTASPDGTRTAFGSSLNADREQGVIDIGRWDARGRAVVDRLPVPDEAPVAYATAVAWTERGLLVRVATYVGTSHEYGPTTLYEVDPDTRTWRPVVTGAVRGFPVTVAPGVMGAGTVPAVRPVVTGPERVRNAITAVRPQTYLLGLGAGGVVVLLWRRVRRRGKSVPPAAG